MFAGSMPNFRTSAAAVETATKCLATARSSPSALTHQARAVRAFVSVSIVVNVLDDTTKSVSAGSRSRVDATKSAPSTLDTKRRTRRRSPYQRSASAAIAGPRSEPPIPMLTTFRIGRPVKHRALLGDVDLVAREHRVPPRGHAGGSREVEQQPDRLVGHAVLGVVEVEPGRLRDQPLAAPWILREQLPQVDATNRLVVGGERLPLRAARQWRRARQFRLSLVNVRQRAPSHTSTAGLMPTKSPVPTTPGIARSAASSAAGSAIGPTWQSSRRLPLSVTTGAPSAVRSAAG